MLSGLKSLPSIKHRNASKLGHGWLLVVLLMLLAGTPVTRTLAYQTALATYTIIKDNKSQNTIFVTGAGASVTLDDIVSGLGANNLNYLVNSNGVWQLNANLLLGEGVTLTLSPATGVSELRLRSGSTGLVTSSAVDAIDSVAAIDYKTFVYLKTENGAIQIDGVKIYSWDGAAPDTNYSNGRAYILAKFAATLTVHNADIGYLGSSDGESYGLAWRDDDGGGNVLRTRVTGELINSKIHHNYYGVYTYQAQNMVFRGNEFYNNIRYGFDPHDYSHHVLVENNVAHDNGAHGFIISRGCNNFTFRNNKSYNNFDPGSNLAHGFMLDPGGAGISKPQVSSSNNLLENNEAYGNEGYGLRILGSGDNEIRNNYFHHNNTGISIDGDGVDSMTTNNLIQGNRFEENAKVGVFVRVAHQNQILNNSIKANLGSGIDLRKSNANQFTGNSVLASGNYGVFLSEGSKQNFFQNNTIQGNQNYGISVSGSSTTGNRWSQNLIFGNVAGGIQGSTQLVAAPVLQSVTGNSVTGQAKAGVTIEIFADNGAQGQFFVGQTTAGGDGQFTFTNNNGWSATNVTAIAVEGTTNASTFSAPLPVGAVTIPTPSSTPSPTPTATSTGTATATATATPTTIATATSGPTPTGTQTITPVTATATATTPPAVTGTAKPTMTATPTGTITPGATRTPTPTAVSTPGGTGSTYQLYLPAVYR
jgi:parallel beta-helix repeat protein